MPDSFFTSSKPRKRKRSASSAAHTEAPPGKRFLHHHKSSTTKQRKLRRVDEELSDRTDEGGDGGSGVEDMDLRVNMDEDDLGASGEEDENETPAEKRLRLAQLYLDSVKVDLGEFIVNSFSIHFFIDFFIQWTENMMLLKSTGNSSRLVLSKMYWTILAKFIFLSQILYVISITPFLCPLSKKVLPNF